MESLTCAAILVRYVHTKVRRALTSLYRCWLKKSAKRSVTPLPPGVEPLATNLQSSALADSHDRSPLSENLTSDVRQQPRGPLSVDLTSDIRQQPGSPLSESLTLDVRQQPRGTLSGNLTSDVSQQPRSSSSEILTSDKSAGKSEIPTGCHVFP